MKNIYALLTATVVLFASCSKRDYYPGNTDPDEYIRNRERGVVAYVDNYTGNYIVDTYRGFAVVESWGGISPREYDEQYAYFSNRGLQTIYNYSGNYFSEGRIAESWLTWSDALYVIDELSYQH